MTPTRFVKHYACPHQRAAAARHHAWLGRHARPICQPTLTTSGLTSLTFEYIDGRHASPPELPRLAAHMGDAHGAAWISDLCQAQLERPHPLGDGGVLADFPTCREAALRTRLADGYLPDQQALDALTNTLRAVTRGPAAFYKDTNPRNLLITDDDTIYTVDTDDLTLAPFGYDLAKLITTLAMTHGALSAAEVDEALNRYNRAAARHTPHLGHTSRVDLDSFLTLHAALTAPYAGRGGYEHPAQEGA